MGMKAETALVLAKKEIDKKISEAEINPIGLDSTLTDEKKAATASVVGEKITELKGDLVELEEGFNDFVQTEYNVVDTTLISGVMTQNGTLVETGNHVVVDVKPNERYRVTGFKWNDGTWFPAYLQLNGDEVVEFSDGGSSGGAFTDLDVTISKDVNKLVVNGNSYIVVKKMKVLEYETQKNFEKVSKTKVDYKTSIEVIPTTVIPNIMSNDGNIVEAGNRIEIPVDDGDILYVSGRRWSDYVPSYVMLDENRNVLHYEKGETTEYFTDLRVIVPKNVRILVVNGNAKQGLRAKKFVNLEYAEETKRLRRKTAVWFGTSIPQNECYFDGGLFSIPSYVGKILGMYTINECVGASCAKRGNHDYKTTDDPYGWTGLSWYTVFRSMGKSLAEAQDLIDNYESKWYSKLGGSEDPLYTNAKPQTLTDAHKNEILSCSYENKLLPYLNGTKQMPDLFVFEHGHNDYYDDSTFGTLPSDDLNYDMSTYSGAMSFFIQKIFEANPQAKVIIVSHYDKDSDKGTPIWNAQKQLAEYWNIPFCDVASNIGWTQRKVKTTGSWVNNVWTIGSTEQTMTRRQQAIPDDLHPHLDASGNAVKREAQIIADWINSNVNLD